MSFDYSLVTLFENDTTLDVHRESILNILSSLLKSTDNHEHDDTTERIFHLCFNCECFFFRVLSLPIDVHSLTSLVTRKNCVNDEKLGVCALRAISSLLRCPLPAFVVNALCNSDQSDGMLSLLLKQSSATKKHFVIKILSFLMQEGRIIDKLSALGVSEVIYSHLFSEDLQAFKTNGVMREEILRSCFVSLIRCCGCKEDEEKRAEAVDLLSLALSLRERVSQADDSRYLNEMFTCVLPTTSTSPRNCSVDVALQTNALRVISQLLLNSETSRISVQSSHINNTASRISRSNPPQQVKSLLRTLHALSRSVHHLKTTFDNKHFVEFVVDCLLNESDSEFLTLATSLIDTNSANLSLHYCSARSFLFDAIAPLSALAQRNKTPSITLNAIWALMNLSCQSTASVRLSILGHFASAEALSLLSDADEYLFAKVLSLYRNLYCQDPFTTESSDVLNSLNEQSFKNAPSVIEMIKRSFESHFSVHTKEIALNLLANLCAIPSCQMAVANDEILLACIMNELRSVDSSAHIGAVLAICNLLSGDDRSRRDLQALLTNSALPHLLSHIHRTSAAHNIHLIRRYAT
ncbi:unnamed protein product [Anisakis simplex]|uniref:Armadillo repeat-containing protein 8 n=1 Tax=Anisakis simplex TaxID=6269 RepID=A0A3P6QS28_ANISI|nr:unnamed protein product [Anisakis simplex]